MHFSSPVRKLVYNPILFDFPVSVSGFTFSHLSRRNLNGAKSDHKHTIKIEITTKDVAFKKDCEQGGQNRKRKKDIYIYSFI